MDDAALIALMERLDGQPFAEWPVAFDWTAARARFTATARELNQLIAPAVQLPLELHVEDAGYHAAIELVPESGWWLRFSNFGDLVALLEDEYAPQDVLERVIAFVEARDFTYVPYRLLARPYPKGLVPDWWTRFFDYY
ncbi:MAG TPA: hypothetical protein VIV58_21815 [Kofleriaceae bacterium]